MLQEFNLQLLIRIAWFDERIRPHDWAIKKMTVLEGGMWHLDRLWAPSLHVPNSKQPNILHDKVETPVLTRIQSDGKILVSKRFVVEYSEFPLIEIYFSINLQGTNQMNFLFYPLDVQKITFQIESSTNRLCLMYLRYK